MRFPVLCTLALALSGCVDLNQSRPYACRADASVSELSASPDCAAGQICGFEGFCRAEQTPGPFRCDRPTGFGCGTGWFCTLEGVCRETDAGGPYRCERFNPDAGAPPRTPTYPDGAPNDCGNPGWRCGSRGTCQQIGVPGEYPCELDTDCEARGRCGGAGVCVNPDVDRLLPRDAGVLNVTVLSPRAVLPSSDAFALSQAPPSPLPFVQASLGKVEAIADDLSLLSLGDAGRAVDVGSDDKTAYVSTDEGFTLLPFDHSPGVSFPELSGARIRTTAFQVLAFNDAGLYWLPGQDIKTPTAFDVPDGGPLQDMAFVPGSAGKGDLPCVLAMHGEGLALGADDTKNGFMFVPVDLGLCVGSCVGAKGALEGDEFRLATTENALTVTSLNAVKAGRSVVSLWDSDWSPTSPILLPGGGQFSNTRCGAAVRLEFANCEAPCDTAHLVDVRPLENTSGVAHAVCREEQSGRPVLTTYALSVGGSSCVAKAQFFESSLFTSNARVTSKPDAVTAVGEVGQLWGLSRWDEPQILTLDHTATGSVSFSDGGTFLFADPVIAYSAPMGLLTAAPESVLFEKPVAEVGDAPSWYVGESRRFIEGPRSVRGSIKLNAADFQPPIRAQRISRPGGNTVMVASVRDTLLAAELPSDGGFFEALPRLVPQARVDIVSLALTGDVPDGGYLGGYLLTTGGVFQVSAEAVNRWHTSELTLPETDPLALWTDGLRGRVGMPNGSIYSLPSRVRIARPLEEPVVAFGTLCDEPFALTSKSLYRLRYGENEGSWEPVPEALAPLSARLPPGFDLTPELADGRLLQLPGKLLIVTKSGAAVELSPENPCLE
ncbi:MAG: hypothetical protein ACJ790_16690 [Myxococcaceae bacterium]